MCYFHLSVLQNHFRSVIQWDELVKQSLKGANFESK